MTWDPSKATQLNVVWLKNAVNLYTFHLESSVQEHHLREFVDIVPREFLCKKSRHSSQAAKLWQLGTISKGVLKMIMSEASKGKNRDPYLVAKKSRIVCQNDFESTVA